MKKLESQENLETPCMVPIKLPQQEFSAFASQFSFRAGPVAVRE